LQELMKYLLRPAQDKDLLAYTAVGVEEMMVEKYRIGNTLIIVHDDAYAGKSQEEIDTILARIANIAANAIQ
jgi:hypothetical protein